jgi:chorismate synthase
MGLRFLTSGESHGPQLTVIVDGYPSGVKVKAEDINEQLKRRMFGYGRGGRMIIESDQIRFVSGIRHGKSIGSPVTMVIENRDWKNWTDTMSATPAKFPESRLVTRPRPGHADLTGAMKYDHKDMRNILERASARETAARVSAGALCRILLEEFDIKLYSHIVAIGKVKAKLGDMTTKEIIKSAEKSPVRCADENAGKRMCSLIDKCKKAGDTLGGVYEVIITGAPPGLGSYIQHDLRLDAKLAAAILSIPATKGMEIGMGFDQAYVPGSEVHDPIAFSKGTFRRMTNNAGGLEGGMTNGEDIIIRGAMKPISTLMKPLKSVDLKTKKTFDAVKERSDVCAVPAAGIVAEAVVATVLCEVFLDKFGNDNLREIKRNFTGYKNYISKI